MVNAVAEQGAVGQPGQGVVERLVGELLLQRGALGHVTDVQHQPTDPRVVGEVGADALGVAPGPVGVLQPALEAGGRPRRLDQLGEGGHDVVPVVGVRELTEGGPDQVGGWSAEQPLARGALVADRAVGREHRDQVGGVVDQGTELGSLLGTGAPQQQPHGERDQRAEQAKRDLDPDQPAE